MAVIKTAKSTGGLGNAALPNILSCIAIRRDTKPSAGNGRKSYTAFNFFAFVIFFTSFLLFTNFRPYKTWKLENAAGTPYPSLKSRILENHSRVQKTSPIAPYLRKRFTVEN